MRTDDRLMFHLTAGALRRFTLWSEAAFPAWAEPHEERKWLLFQSWKREPYKVTGTDKGGQPIYVYHPMGEFENWSLWLVLEMIRHLRMPRDTYALFEEPENLKMAIVDWCEELYSDYENQSPSQLVR